MLRTCLSTCSQGARPIQMQYAIKSIDLHGVTTHIIETEGADIIKERELERNSRKNHEGTLSF